MGTTHGIFIVDNRLRVLCVHPTGAPDKFWSIPKGGSNDNESSLEAAIRELKEETNLDYNQIKPKLTYYEYIGVFPYSVKGKKLKAHVTFFDAPLSKMEFNLRCLSKIEGKDDLECDKVEWKDLDFALRNLHHTQVSALKKVIKNLTKKNIITLAFFRKMCYICHI